MLLGSALNAGYSFVELFQLLLMPLIEGCLCWMMLCKHIQVLVHIVLDLESVLESLRCEVSALPLYLVSL